MHARTHARTHAHTHTALSPTHVYCILILCMYMPQTAFVHLLITHLCWCLSHHSLLWCFSPLLWSPLPPFLCAPHPPVVPSPSFSLCSSPLLWSPLPPFLCASHPSCVPLSLLFSVLLTPPVFPSPSFSLCSSPLLCSPLPPFLCAPHPSCGPLSLLFSVLLTPPVFPSPSFSLCFSSLLWFLPLQIILSLSLTQTLSSKEEMQEESLSVFSGLDPLSNIKSILQSLGTFIVDVRQAELK